MARQDTSSDVEHAKNLVCIQKARGSSPLSSTGRSESGVAVEEIAHLAGHASSRTTETIYRHEIGPVITTGADVMDKIFIQA